MRGGGSQTGSTSRGASRSRRCRRCSPPRTSVSSRTRTPPHTATTVPHKLFQYMAMGRPVVASDLPPLRAVVADADAGLLAPAGDAGAWADAFETLRADPAARERYGANGRRAAVDRYNWARDAERLVDCYERLAE
ncbi:glycosyltransferase [Candidatus Halobonum tyrrellensis]|uniref:glycosyltransferase n=1 Tax=Candidatus Halobonum tyrrellensis TaxID=1431545 RepID=UPI00373AE23E